MSAPTADWTRGTDAEQNQTKSYFTSRTPTAGCVCAEVSERASEIRVNECVGGLYVHGASECYGAFPLVRYGTARYLRVSTST